MVHMNLIREGLRVFHTVVTALIHKIVHFTFQRQRFVIAAGWGRNVRSCNNMRTKSVLRSVAIVAQSEPLERVSCTLSDKFVHSVTVDLLLFSQQIYFSLA